MDYSSKTATLHIILHGFAMHFWQVLLLQSLSSINNWQLPNMASTNFPNQATKHD